MCPKLKEKKITRKVKISKELKNTINLTSTELSEPHKSLLQKGPSFVPTPSDVNWYDVNRDFDKFVH